MRLFVAMELSEIARAHLVDVQRQLRSHVTGGSWPAVGNLHLTLKFLGEVADAQLPGVLQALQTVSATGVIALSAAGLELFPARGPVRIIAAGLNGDLTPLGALQEAIETACASVGFVRENRAFRPHVTLGRARNPWPGGLRAHLHDHTAKLWPGPTFTAGGFVLMHSRLDARGAQYTPVAHLPLA